MNLKTLIRGGTVVSMDPAIGVIEGGDVLVSGDTIEAVGRPVNPGRTLVRLVDATGMIVIPGLIQTHVHLVQTLFRGAADDLDLLEWLRGRIWPLEGAMDEASTRAAARLGLAELIASGTTTILDMGCVHHADVLFEECGAAGIRATIGKLMMDAGQGVPFGLRERTKDSIDEALRLLRDHHHTCNDRLRFAFAPRFALSCTDELLREAAALAKKHGVVFTTHASENPTETHIVREQRGVENVTYLVELGAGGENVFLAHCVWLTAHDLRLLRETGTRVVHCPSANLKLGSGVAKIPEMRAAGVSVTLGADGAPCNNNLDAWHEMRLAALLHKPRVGVTSMDAKSVFTLCTSGAAEALGMAGQIGCLRPGAKADVVLVRADGPHALPAGDVFGRLVYAHRAPDVHAVMADGAWLFRDGRWLTLEAPRVRRDAIREFQRIAEKAL